MNKMIVSRAKYCKDVNNNNAYVNATIDGVVMSVPMDPANRHYEAILEWVADGNTIEAAS